MVCFVMLICSASVCVQCNLDALLGCVGFDCCVTILHPTFASLHFLTGCCYYYM